MAATLGAAVAGCQFGGSGGGGTTPPAGYGRPTVAVTINGVHFGPGAPAAGSGASFATARDASTGRVSDSRLTLGATEATSGAGCQLAFERFGDNIAPIGALAYQLSSTTAPLGGTPDRMVAPVGGEQVFVGGTTLQCTGSECDGALLAITVLDAAHIEGYFSGTLNATSGAGAGEVVCSFYLPVSGSQ